MEQWETAGKPKYASDQHSVVSQCLLFCASTQPLSTTSFLKTDGQPCPTLDSSHHCHAKNKLVTQGSEHAGASPLGLAMPWGFDMHTHTEGSHWDEHKTHTSRPCMALVRNSFLKLAKGLHVLFPLTTLLDGHSRHTHMHTSEI